MSAFGLSFDGEVALIIAWLSIAISLAAVSISISNFRWITRQARHARQDGDDWDCSVSELIKMFSPPEPAPAPETIPSGMAVTEAIPISPLTPRPYVPKIPTAARTGGECGLCKNGPAIPGKPCAWCGK